MPETRITVTDSDLLEALREAIERRGEDSPDDAFSVDELSDAMGCHPATARKAIKRMIGAGTVEPVRVKRRAMDGRLANVVAYRLRDGARLAA